MLNSIIHHGDCLEILKTLPDNSIDSVVTDPPYHLTSTKRGAHKTESVKDTPFTRARIGDKGFMGHEWDGGEIAHRVELWQECLRVLKPGGHLLSFAGSRTYHRMAVAIEDAGFEIRDQIMWITAQGFPKSKNLSDVMEGWGTQLKPSHEPICMARKPCIGTVTKNMQEFGVGGINVDGCKVPIDIQADTSPQVVSENGRFPANVIHDGSEEILAYFPDTPGQQGFVESSKSAARFFYCAKTTAKDRHEGLNEGGNNIPHGSTYRQIENLRENGKLTGNHHPTVKPVELMKYLCRLVTPEGGTVLDPFMGSGSTGKAAVLEGFKFIGIEITDEYIPIATARIKHAEKS